MITQSMFRQIKDPKTPLTLSVTSCQSVSQSMVLRPTYPYQIPLAKTSRRGRDLYRIVFPRSSSYAAYSSCLGLLYILEYLIVRLVRFVLLLLLLFNFVMHCIISTIVVAFEINYLILSESGNCWRQKSGSLTVTATCTQLSAIKRILNHWLYVTVNNLCKQL